MTREGRQRPGTGASDGSPPEQAGSDHGGAQGIGLALAQAFIAEGAKVVLADLDGRSAQAPAGGLGHDVVEGIACDVVNAADVEAALELAVTRFGTLDIVVNNAGITRDATMRNMTEEQFDQVVAVHLKGCWNGTRLAAEHMRERKQGRSSTSPPCQARSK